MRGMFCRQFYLDYQRETERLHQQRTRSALVVQRAYLTWRQRVRARRKKVPWTRSPAKNTELLCGMTQTCAMCNTHHSPTCCVPQEASWKAAMLEQYRGEKKQKQKRRRRGDLKSSVMANYMVEQAQERTARYTGQVPFNSNGAFTKFGYGNVKLTRSTKRYLQHHNTEVEEEAVFDISFICLC